MTPEPTDTGQRGRVRHLQAHDDLGDDTYHEWVERGAGVNDCEMLDSIGRKQRGGWTRWDYWRCNNTDCNALALVSAVAVETAVQEWLNA